MQFLIYILLIILLLIAALQDCRGYRIKNSLVMSGAFIGILLNIIIPSGLGFYESLIGWCVGLFLLLPLYLLRMMGAGDVKLMAMVGAFLGMQATVIALLYTLVCGGVLSIIIALHRGGLNRLGQLIASVQISVIKFVTNLITFKANPNRTVPFTASINGGDLVKADSAKMPYGVAIAAGTIIYLVTYSISSI